MPQTRKKSVHRNAKALAESHSSMNGEDDYTVLDQATICAEWYRLWSSFGFSEQQWSSRAAKVEEYTRKLLENKLLSYKEQLNKRKKLLKQSMEDYDDLILRTGLTSLIDINIFEKFKLKEQEIYIDKKMQELLINEGQLVQQRNELENKQKQLCTLLHSSPIEFDENVTMSLAEINKKIQDHIKMLCDLKDLRRSQVQSYYLKLKEYSERLEWTPPQSSTVESLLFEKFDRCLTADSLNEIENTIHDLEIQIETQKARFFELHSQLGHLYERLGKNPEKDYCLIYKHGSDNINKFAIKQLEHEIACCREERMKNGKEYRNSIRQQIIDLLEKAYLGNDERTILNKLDFETLTPEILDAYDAEYERINQLYEKRKPILDAYEKWLSFWNDFVAFTKASTDPGRFRTRGYNAEAEGRKRKKFLQELPHVEQKFLNALSENNDPSFLIDNVPIRQKFDEAHLQVPASALPSTIAAKTAATIAVTQHSSALTPIRSRTPAATPRQLINKETHLATTARRLAKTPSAATSRKLLTKVTSKTECQPKRAKPRPPPVSNVSPPRPAVVLPVHPPARTDDQALDFSLLHTIKNIHGQIKVMTSTPNSSFDIIETRNGGSSKTANNIIGRRKSKRLSKRTPVSIIMVQQVTEETIVCL